MEYIEITVGGDKAGENIPARPINLIFKDPSHPVPVEAPKFLTIRPEHCIYHAERVTNFHHRTPELVELVVQDEEGRPEWSCLESQLTIRTGGGNREACPFEIRHLIGRIDMTLKFLDLGIRKFHWVHPEAGLHPRWALGLADLLITLKTESEEEL